MKAVSFGVDCCDDPVEVPLNVVRRVLCYLPKFSTIGEDVIQLLMVFLGVDEDIGSCLVGSFDGDVSPMAEAFGGITKFLGQDSSSV